MRRSPFDCSSSLFIAAGALGLCLFAACASVERATTPLTAPDEYVTRATANPTDNNSGIVTQIPPAILEKAREEMRSINSGIKYNRNGTITSTLEGGKTATLGTAAGPGQNSIAPPVWPEMISPLTRAAGGDGKPFAWPWRRKPATTAPQTVPFESDMQLEAVSRKFNQSPSFYSHGEELWIITKPVQVASRIYDDQYPGAGALLAKRDNKEIPLPLEHTDVKAKVAGYIATVEVAQQFSNPYSSKIEAVYVFPLPENSAVNEFVMVIGDRHIRGIIRERAEAERIYESARSQGYLASLLTQERPNIFTQSVANIEPGKRIDVNIKYYNTLAFMDGWFEFVFPMVVGPRFNPAGEKRGIGVSARTNPGISGQQTEVSYLQPDEKSPHKIDLQLEINAGVPIEEFESPTHKIKREPPQFADRMTVSLDHSDRVPNRDFVFRFRVTGDQIKSGLLTHRDERGGFFTMMLYPPAHLSTLARQPMEMVFVLDCSGSMGGRPLAQAKEAVRAGLKLLEPEDTFQLITFSMSASQLGSRPLAASSDNLRKALKYLDELDADGGTMMIEGIKAALDFPHDPWRLRFVSFLTDGYIGNESEILAAIQEKLGSSRIFSFGVGSAVNRYLLDNMARVGRGAVAYFLPETRTGPVMREFFERISHPGVTDLQVDWAEMSVSDVFPKNIPDLYPGRPVILTGRFKGALPGNVVVRGRTPSGEVQLITPILRENESTRSIASLWARAKIAELSLQNVGEARSRTVNQIKKTALDYSLLSEYTAFIAVDSTRRTRGLEGTTVPVAVPVPQGVKYSTTVPEN